MKRPILKDLKLEDITHQKESSNKKLSSKEKTFITKQLILI